MKPQRSSGSEVGAFEAKNTLGTLLDRVEETLRLAERHRLTIYDAAYLEIALRRGLPLATLDRELRAAGIGEKIQLLGV